MVVTRYVAGLLSMMLFVALFRWTTIATFFHLIDDARVLDALFLAWMFCTMVATYYTYRAPPPWFMEWASSARWHDTRIYIEDGLYLVTALPIAWWVSLPHEAEPRTFFGTLIGNTLAILGFGIPLRLYIRLGVDRVLLVWKWWRNKRSLEP